MKRLFSSLPDVMSMIILGRSVPFKLVYICLLALATSGCATTSEHSEKDPLEPVNRVFFTVNEKLDDYLMGPIARRYAKVAPQPVRVGVTNFFDNLFYANVVANALLQGKFKQGVDDLARFFINTTLGVGGVLDLATSAGLIQHQEDLGQTLAKWGVGEGSYLVIPLRGPSTLRDAPDIASSAILSPFFHIETAANYPFAALGVVNKRAEVDREIEFIKAGAVDRYTFTRVAYRQHRAFLIYDGDPPTEQFEDFLDEVD